MSDRLGGQLAFLVEADKLKGILRRTTLMDASRRENSAEHSWHLVLAALVLREHASPRLDLMRVLELVAVHDLVEIDAGDTFAYDAVELVTKAARELAAAERVFGLLPPDQAECFRGRWEEFEAQQTLEARFANALDRLQPLLQNAHSGGGTWRHESVTRDKVLERMSPIQTEMPDLWPMVMSVIDTFFAAGVLRTENQT